MPITFPSNPQVDALRVASETARNNASALEQKLSAARTRAPELARELALAIANGDDATADTLRTERAQIEHDERDLSAAIIIATQRAESAEKAHAVAEWPLVEQTATDAVARFNTAAAELHALSRGIRELIPRAGSRWTTAFGGDGDPMAREDRPVRVVPRLFSGVSAVIYRSVSDLT